MIKIRCVCGNVVLAPEEKIGHIGNCPSCDRAIKVEVPDGEMASLLNVEENNNKQKTPVITKFLAITLYLVFCFLVISMALLHSVSYDQLANFHLQKFPWGSKLWEEHKETVLLIKNQQYNWFKDVIDKNNVSEKKVANPVKKEKTEKNKGLPKKQEKENPKDESSNPKPEEQKENSDNSESGDGKNTKEQEQKIKGDKKPEEEKKEDTESTKNNIPEKRE